MKPSIYIYFFAILLIQITSCCRPDDTCDDCVEPNGDYDFNLRPGFKQLVGRSSDNTPKDNPTTKMGVELGRHLFYDKRLSKNNTIACASCHLQEFAFTDTARFSLGFEGGKTPRNSMPIFNLRWTPSFFWDTRAATLEEQTLMPIQDHLEMGMTLEEVVEKLKGLGEYDDRFEKAFETPEITSDRISKGLSQFLRSIVSQNSRYDDAEEQGDRAVFTEQEMRGKKLFSIHVDPDPENVPGSDGRGANCNDCHVLSTPNLSDYRVSNNGLDMDYSDPGYGKHSSTDKWQGTFKTPPLRNIELTAPYMHDGRFKTLREVIDHYDLHIEEHRNLGRDLVISGNYRPMKLDLTDDEKDDLIAFLKTLTDKELTTNPAYSNPFEE